MEFVHKSLLFFIFSNLLVFNIEATISENEPELFVAAETAVWRMKTDGSSKTLFAKALNATSVDFHNAKRLVFWSDVEAHKIYSKDMFNESAEVKVVIDGGKEWEPRAIAIDYLHDKIYVIDQAGLKIDVFELDGSKKVEGLVKNMTEPDQGNWKDMRGPSTLDIAVDPFRGLVFYGEYNRVMRATMDFSNLKYIGHKSFVSGITVDPQRKVFYYTNVNRLLYQTTYDGSIIDHVNAYDHPTDIYRGTPISPRSITHIDMIFFYLDWRRNEHPGVYRLIKYYYNAVDKEMVNAWTVRVRHPSLQKRSADMPIQIDCDNNACEYMCLISNEQYSSRTYSCFNEAGERE